MDEERALGLPHVLGLTQADSPRKSQHLETVVADLYESMRPSLLGYVYQLVGSTSDAEDLVQLAFLKAFDQLRRKTQIQSLETEPTQSPGKALKT